MTKTVPSSLIDILCNYTISVVRSSSGAFRLKNHSQALFLHYIKPEFTLTCKLELISMSISNRKVSCINNYTNICNIFKSKILT